MDRNIQPGTLISGKRQLSREEMFRRAGQASTGFDSLDIGAGDAVALMLRNDFPFFEATFAAGRLGAYALPINWHFQSDEVSHILRDSGAKVLLLHADLIPQLGDAVPDDVTLLVVPTPEEIISAYDISPDAAKIPPGHVNWYDWIESFAKWTQPGRRRPGALLYTSGTTGQPKGVRRKTADAAQAKLATQVGEYLYGFGPHARSVLTGPMYHAGPNVYGLQLAATGDRLILQPRFDAGELLDLIEEHQITSLNLVPTMLVRLLRLPEARRQKFDAASLTHVAHAAAPCPPDIKQAMIDWWGPVIMELYGGTESGPVAACDSAEWLAHPGTIGRALPGSILRILDPDGATLSAGQVGEIYVQSEANSEFTYHGDDTARQDIERDGFISLGDMGYLDDDGFLFISDRKKDMVISGGVNIYPAEIEAALITLDGVRDCAVFGIPEPEFGEQLMAYIEPDPNRDLTEDQIRAGLDGKLAGYKIPRRIEFTSALPREDSGKIYKRKLRAPYWQDQTRKI